MKIIGDFKTSLKKALKEIDPKWESYNGLIIAGSWPGENDPDLVFEAINVFKEYESKGLPVLGICFGHQIVALAHGEELEKLDKLKVGVFETGYLWGFEWVKSKESFWHQYKVGGKYGDLYENDNVITTQFHPEYQSSKKNPHYVLIKFLKLCKKVHIK